MTAARYVSDAERALDVGTKLARFQFFKRGNHSEIHLSETELAAVLTVAAERAQERANATIAALLDGIERCEGHHGCGAYALVHRVREGK